MTTRILRAVHFGATGAIVTYAMRHHTEWRLIAVMLARGLLTGVWAFSIGWDAATSNRTRR